MSPEASTTALVITRGMKRGLVTLLREHGWAATLLTLGGILVIAQLFVTMAVAGWGLESLIRSRMDIRLEILEDAPEQRILELFEALKKHRAVDDASYITRQKAYELERARDPELVQFLEQFNLGNPFPETFAVTLRSLDSYADFAAFVKSSEWSDVLDPSFLTTTTDQEKKIHELLRVAQAAQAAVFAFLFLTAIVLLFVLMELVRRRALVRSEEILVERLFGASDLAVLVPFATESTLLLLASLIGSIVVVLLVIGLLPVIIPALHPTGVLGTLRNAVVPMLLTFLPFAFFLELIAAPLLSLLGAWLGMRGQLRSRKLLVTA